VLKCDLTTVPRHCDDGAARSSAQGPSAVQIGTAPGVGTPGFGRAGRLLSRLRRGGRLLRWPGRRRHLGERGSGAAAGGCLARDRRPDGYLIPTALRARTLSRQTAPFPSS
jgi:hypothetical protein